MQKRKLAVRLGKLLQLFGLELKSRFNVWVDEFLNGFDTVEVFAERQILVKAAEMSRAVSVARYFGNAYKYAYGVLTR